MGVNIEITQQERAETDGNMLCSVKKTGKGDVESGKPAMMISFPASSSSSGTLEQMSEIMSSGNGYTNHLMKGGRGNLRRVDLWR